MNARGAVLASGLVLDLSASAAPKLKTPNGLEPVMGGEYARVDRRG